MSAPERCPSCGGLNPSEADWCGQCFRRFTPPPPPPPAQPATPPGAAATPTGGATTVPSLGGPGPALPGEATAADRRPGVLPSPDELPEGSVARDLVERAVAVGAAGPGISINPAAVGSRRGAFAVSDQGIVWTCSQCDTENPLDLSACAVCGTPFAKAVDPDSGRKVRDRDPGTTALVSFAFPGAGHAYLGLWGQATARGILFAWIVLVALLAAVQADPAADRIAIVFGLAAFAQWVVGAHDSFREASHQPERVLLKGRVFLYMVLGLLMLLVMMIVQSGLSLRAA